MTYFIFTILLLILFGIIIYFLRIILNNDLLNDEFKSINYQAKNYHDLTKFPVIYDQKANDIINLIKENANIWKAKWEPELEDYSSPLVLNYNFDHLYKFSDFNYKYFQKFFVRDNLIVIDGKIYVLEKGQYSSFNTQLTTLGKEIFKFNKTKTNNIQEEN